MDIDVYNSVHVLWPTLVELAFAKSLRSKNVGTRLLIDNKINPLPSRHRKRKEP